MYRGEERQHGHDEDWVKTENRKKQRTTNRRGESIGGTFRNREKSITIEHGGFQVLVLRLDSGSAKKL